MAMHSDFVKIYKRFIIQYGEMKGKDFYDTWSKKKGYNDTREFPGGAEKKELMCHIRGFEIKELSDCFHVEGLIATSHIDDLDRDEDVDIPDRIPKETLESFASQVNTKYNAGDFEGAQKSSKQTKQFMIWTIVAGLVGVIAYIAIIGTSFLIFFIRRVASYPSISGI